MACIWIIQAEKISNNDKDLMRGEKNSSDLICQNKIVIKYNVQWVLLLVTILSIVYTPVLSHVFQLLGRGDWTLVYH